MEAGLHFLSPALMERLVTIREWDPEEFHRKVMEMELQGWVADRDSYKITAEMHPETGLVTHLHAIEMSKPDSATKGKE